MIQTAVRRYQAACFVRWLREQDDSEVFQPPRESAPDQSMELLARQMYILAAVRIQSVFRGFWVRDCLNVDHYCATLIQKNYRRHLYRSMYLAEMERVDDDDDLSIFAVVIQAVVRSYLSRRKVQVDRVFSAQRHAAATAIQTRWRAYVCELDFIKTLVDVLIVQSIARSWLAKKRVQEALEGNRDTPSLQSVQKARESNSFSLGYASSDIGQVQLPERNYDVATSEPGGNTLSRGAESFLSNWKPITKAHPSKRTSDLPFDEKKDDGISDLSQWRNRKRGGRADTGWIKPAQMPVVEPDCMSQETGPSISDPPVSSKSIGDTGWLPNSRSLKQEECVQDSLGVNVDRDTSRPPVPTRPKGDTAWMKPFVPSSPKDALSDVVVNSTDTSTPNASVVPMARGDTTWMLKSTSVKGEPTSDVVGVPISDDSVAHVGNDNQGTTFQGSERVDPEITAHYRKKAAEKLNRAYEDMLRELAEQS